jgi:predicted DNA-binding transcriptional regulator
MKLDKEDIVIAKEMAKTLQQSKNSELIVVGNLLSHLLAEREAPQRTWVGLTDEDKAQCIQATAKRGSTYELISAIEAKLREKNT